VVIKIVPAQGASLDTAYHDYLANNGLAEDDPGMAVNETTAAGIIALRANDGRVPNSLPPDFIGGIDLGEWRPTPSEGANSAVGALTRTLELFFGTDHITLR